MRDRFESIALVPDAANDYDQLWFVVNRTNGRFIEYMTSRLNSIDCGGVRQVLLDEQIFMDSTLSYDDPITISSIDSVGSSTLVSTELAHGFSSGDIVVLSCAGDFDGRFEVEAIAAVDNIILLLHGNDDDGSIDIVDSSQYGNTITVVGSTAIDTGQSKFGGSSILFPGSETNYLKVPDSSNFTWVGRDMTWHSWVRFNVLPSVGQAAVLYGQGNTNPMVPGGAQTITILVQDNGGGGKDFSFIARNTTTTQTDVTVSITTNVWYHFAVVKSGLTIYMFFNGALVATDSTYQSSDFGNYTADIHIGHSGHPTLDFFLNGWMDEYVLTNEVLWTATFAVPTIETVRPSSSFRILDATLGTPIDSSTFTAFSGTGYARLVADTFTGLEHLEGEEVAVLADGVPQEHEIVTDGSVVLSSEFGLVHIGLPYFSDVELLPIEVNQ